MIWILETVIVTFFDLVGGGSEKREETNKEELPSESEKEDIVGKGVSVHSPQSSRETCGVEDDFASMNVSHEGPKNEERADPFAVDFHVRETEGLDFGEEGLDFDDFGEDGTSAGGAGPLASSSSHFVGGETGVHVPVHQAKMETMDAMSLLEEEKKRVSAVHVPPPKVEEEVSHETENVNVKVAELEEFVEGNGSPIDFGGDEFPEDPFGDVSLGGHNEFENVGVDSPEGVSQEHGDSKGAMSMERDGEDTNPTSFPFSTREEEGLGTGEDAIDFGGDEMNGSDFWSAIDPEDQEVQHEEEQSVPEVPKPVEVTEHEEHPKFSLEGDESDSDVLDFGGDECEGEEIAWGVDDAEIKPDPILGGNGEHDQADSKIVSDQVSPEEGPEGGIDFGSDEMEGGGGEATWDSGVSYGEETSTAKEGFPSSTSQGYPVMDDIGSQFHVQPPGAIASHGTHGMSMPMTTTAFGVDHSYAQEYPGVSPGFSATTTTTSHPPYSRPAVPTTSWGSPDTSFTSTSTAYSQPMGESGLHQPGYGYGYGYGYGHEYQHGISAPMPSSAAVPSAPQYSVPYSTSVSPSSGAHSSVGDVGSGGWGGGGDLSGGYYFSATPWGVQTSVPPATMGMHSYPISSVPVESSISSYSTGMPSRSHGYTTSGTRDSTVDLPGATMEYGSTSKVSPAEPYRHRVPSLTDIPGEPCGPTTMSVGISSPPGVQGMISPMISPREGESSGTERTPVPIVSFGFGGKIIIMFPRRAHRLNVLTRVPSTEFMEIRQGKVHVLDLGSVVPQAPEEDHMFNHFPGALTPETPVEHVVAYMDGLIPHLPPQSPIQMLWMLLRALVQNKGVVNPDAIVPILNLQDGLGSSSFVADDGSQMAPTILRKDDSASSSVDQQKIAMDVQERVFQGDFAGATRHAMNGHMWPIALLLASYVDKNTYMSVVQQYASHCLMDEAPLKTLFMLMADQTTPLLSSPSTTVFGSEQWREHLAIMIRNEIEGRERMLIQMGDRLWREKSSVELAHFCYLLAHRHLDSINTMSTARMVLVGGDHRRDHSAFFSPMTLQMTEIFEYATILKDPRVRYPSLLPFRLLHAERLLELGHVQQACAYVSFVQKVLASNPKIGGAVGCSSFKARLLAFTQRLNVCFGEKRVEELAAMSHMRGGMADASSAAGSKTKDGFRWFRSIIDSGISKMMSDSDDTMSEGKGSARTIPIGMSMPGIDVPIPVPQARERSVEGVAAERKVATTSKPDATLGRGTDDDDVPIPVPQARERSVEGVAAERKVATTSKPDATLGRGTDDDDDSAQLHTHAHHPPQSQHQPLSQPPPSSSAPDMGTTADPSMSGASEKDGRDSKGPNAGGIGRVAGFFRGLFKRSDSKEMDLGNENEFYYNEKLKRWVRRGQEEEIEKEMEAMKAPPPMAKPTLSAGSLVDLKATPSPLVQRHVTSRYIDPFNLSGGESGSSGGSGGSVEGSSFGGSSAPPPPQGGFAGSGGSGMHPPLAGTPGLPPRPPTSLPSTFGAPPPPPAFGAPPPGLGMPVPAMGFGSSAHQRPKFLMPKSVSVPSEFPPETQQ
eukprot:TRINITY_DN1788_c0_g1_i1.p1 TRINITY_DN1788_c0_g1~~TRINITY_DN1788_c0_g1_i1.p1  ORF type:complete len:1562 (-),score=490.29 TRINITY_DN1788_c0_g1_i1:393-5078(-)